MSKKKTGSTSAHSSAVVPPKGYVPRQLPIDGYWEPELAPAVHFVPEEIRIYDQKREPNKPSVLIVGRLVDPLEARALSGELVTLEPGARIGLNGKPGMRDILDCCGVKVFLTQSGEKDVGKINPMKLYAVMTPPNAPKKALPIVDRRNKSRGAQCWALPTTNAATAPDPESE